MFEAKRGHLSQQKHFFGNCKEKFDAPIDVF